MVLPLMPKATAVWLIENTALQFNQIAAFTGLHALEVQAIADEEVAVGIVGLDPIPNGQLTTEEIARCEKDPDTVLEMAIPKTPKRVCKPSRPLVCLRMSRADIQNYFLK